MRSSRCWCSAWSVRARSLPLTVLWIAGIINAVNIIDIMDGLASGLGVISATFLLVVALLNGRLMVAAFTVALIGSSARTFTRPRSTSVIAAASLSGSLSARWRW